MQPHGVEGNKLSIRIGMAICETKNHKNDLMLIDNNDLVKPSPYHPSLSLVRKLTQLNCLFKKQNNKPSVRNYPRPDQATTDLYPPIIPY